MTRQITYENAIGKLGWLDAIAAIRAGHLLPKAQIKDMFLGPASGSLLSRGAYIEGLGFGVKSVTVFGANPQVGLPTVQGAMLVFGPENGSLIAIVESKLVTELKTAADSVLGATLLARPDSRELLIVGAGTVARSLVAAYTAAFQSLTRIAIWARRPEQAQALAAEYVGHSVPVVAVSDLEQAAGQADIISSATMATAPVLRGAWLKPGTHVDLIGAFKADMREADDDLIRDNALFVDSRDTTIHHIGELMIPIANGVITPDHVRGDYYDLVAGGAGRTSDDQITVLKNGGGAHLDLMIATALAKAMDQ